jgi:ribokinase
VIGSINMDLVCRTPTMPRPGETILGSNFVTVPGGKGANQAVAAAKLAGAGTPVHMIARVGADDFGQRLLNGLRQHNVGTDYVTVTEGVSSGIAMILVDRKGENSIVVAPGANHELMSRDIDRATDLLRTASAVVVQLEIPLRTVQHAIALCARLGVYTILDPAPVPADGLSRAFFGVDVLTPNQSEAEALLNMKQSARRVRRKGVEDPKQVAMDLLSRGPRSIVLKLGSKGAMAIGRDGEIQRVKAHKVNVVDTTAAGDAFTGALAVARAEGRDAAEALQFANAAGALCCTGFGAQPSLPSRKAVDKLMAG